MRKLLLLLFLILCFTTSGWSATYYMRADGTAANKAAATGPASDAAACMNISVHNGETFSAGDTIHISNQGGDYDCSATNVIIPSSGSSGNPITYQAISGETPTFDAAETNNDIWIADGKSYITIDGVTVKDAIYSLIEFKSNSGGSNNITIQNCTFNGTANAHGIWLRVYSNALSDVLIDRCTFSNLNGDGIEMKHESGTAQISNITIQNCTFDTMYNATPGRHCRGIDIDYVAGDKIADLGAGRIPYGITIQNNSFNRTSDSAIRIYCTDTATNLISNNTVIEAGYNSEYQTNAIILHSCKGATVEYNSVSDTKSNTTAGDGCGIILDWSGNDLPDFVSEDCIVRYNVCYDNTAASSRAAGIIAFRAKNCEIYYNICYGNTMGIFVNNQNVNCTGTVFYNNTIVANNDDGVELAINTEVTTWTNNIIANNGGEGVDDEGIQDLIFTYNCLYNNTGGNYSGFTLGTGCIETDPKLRNTGVNDYRLKSGSPCINTGTDVSLSQDYETRNVPHGPAQEIGAYEYWPNPIAGSFKEYKNRPYTKEWPGELIGN